MKSKWIFLVAALALLLSACAAADIRDTVARETGLKLPDGETIADSDTHGGLHGDGTHFIALRFSGDSLETQIQNSGSWKPFPLDETAQALAYGISDQTRAIGPYLTDGEGNPLIPQVEHGYYLLIDRQDGGGDLLSRASLNCTLAIYDSAAHILYFCKLDT